MMSKAQMLLSLPQFLAQVGNIRPSKLEPYPYNLVDIEREIAEFEANLAKELADQAAKDIMAEIKAEFEAKTKAKAKLPKLQPTVCEPNRDGYEAYMLGIKNQP